MERAMAMLEQAFFMLHQKQIRVPLPRMTLYRDLRAWWRRLFRLRFPSSCRCEWGDRCVDHMSWQAARCFAANFVGFALWTGI